MSWDLQLVALSGPLKGESWELGEKALTLGRDWRSDIRLYSKLASRKHCSISQNGDVLQLEELSPRNPVLVNGRPAHKATLRVGDTLSAGGDVFLVAHGQSGQFSAADERQAGVTPSLGAFLSEPWDRRPKGPGANLPTTAEQLALLFEATHEMAQCNSRGEALACLSISLDGYFKPDAAWFIRAPVDKAKLRIQRLDGDSEFAAKLPSTKILHAVLSTDEGALIQHGANSQDDGPWFSSMAAPLSAAGAMLGAVVLQRGPGSRAYENEDRAFLEVLARACAPFVLMAGTIGNLEQENVRLRRRLGEASELIGESSPMKRIRSDLEKAAQTSLNVLIRGQTGTGKEVAARVLHARSRRARGPFVVVNCAAIPSELFESELFGYRTGAFTGARQDFEGLLFRADGGTLFLDEVADLSAPNQARILRAVELGSFRPLGASEDIHADVRVVAATNKDLEKLISSGQFREDLYHRLTGFEILLPPLSERKGDVPLLAQHFFDAARETAPRSLEGLSPETLTYLAERAWPGNVRELRNVVLRAAATAAGPLVQPEDCGSDALAFSNIPEDESLETCEKRHVAAVLENHNGSVPETADALGIARSTLYKKLAAYGLPRTL